MEGHELSTLLQQSPEEIRHRFDDDNFLFKRTMKEIFLRQISEFAHRDVSPTARFNDVFPRERRDISMHELEAFMKIDFPKLEKSDERYAMILTLFVLPPIICILIYIRYFDFVFPDLLFRLVVTAISPYFPWGAWLLIAHRYFDDLDFKGVKTIGDLLEVLTMLNHQEFRENNYSRMMEELSALKARQRISS